MSQHIQFTMIIFFVGALLTGLFPQYSFVSTNIYTTNDYGEVVYDDTFTSKVSGGLDNEGNIAVSSLGIVDTFFMVIDFIKYILSFFIALPVLIFKLPIDGLVKIMFFFPTLLLYSFTIISWIRRG